MTKGVIHLEKTERVHCKDCQNAKDLQQYRPGLFCSKHRTIINDFTIPEAIRGCKGKHFCKRK